jgi:hypothetical protein
MINGSYLLVSTRLLGLAKLTNHRDYHHLEYLASRQYHSNHYLQMIDDGTGPSLVIPMFIPIQRFSNQSASLTSTVILSIMEKSRSLVLAAGTKQFEPISSLLNRHYRECVGQHFAKDTLWILTASVLATFDFKKAKDENGNEIPIIPKLTDGFVWYSYPCLIHRL